MRERLAQIVDENINWARNLAQKGGNERAEHLLIAAGIGIRARLEKESKNLDAGYTLMLLLTKKLREVRNDLRRAKQGRELSRPQEATQDESWEDECQVREELLSDLVRETRQQYFEMMGW